MRKLKVYILSVWLLAAGAVSAAGQGGPLMGTVTDGADGKPLQGVIVEIVDGGGKTLTYAMTGHNGGFSITSPGEAEGYTLRFSAMSYRKLSVDPAGRTMPLSIALTPEPTQIREVKVKAPDIFQRGDTLVFNVEKYADISDRSIEDVLKKMPGIEVDDNGQIKYQGEPINKFYIEGMDLLDGRYGLATKNISHKDVQNVELMENHQPIRALQDISHSDQAALNIRLKEEAKSRWVGAATAGAGYSPVLYDASLFAMRISGGWQSIENLKVNNTGKNLTKENMRFSTYNLFNEIYTRNLSPELIAADITGAPIDDSRTRFNRSVLFNSTNAFGLENGGRIDAEVNYYGERLTASSRSRTEYFDPGAEDFQETRVMLTHLHEVSARATALINNPSFFLRNDLETQLSWKDALSHIGGSTSTRQDADLPFRQLSNRLQLVKRSGRRTFTVNSDTRYQATPRTLSVDRDGNDIFQDASYSVFHSENDISYGFGAGRWQLSARAGVMFRYNTLESTLSGLTGTIWPVANDLSFFQTRTFAMPSAVYQKRKIRLTLSAPVNLRTYRYKDNITAERTPKTRLTADPAVHLRYDISALLTFTTSARYSSSPVSEQIFYTGAIMRDYRNITIGHTLYDSGTQRSVNAALQYKNLVRSVFAHINAGYTNNTDSPLGARFFADDFVVTTYSDRESTTGTWFASFGASKGIGSGRLTLGLDGSMACSRASMVLENVKTPYRSQSYSISPQLKGQLFSWWNAEYRLKASRNILELKDGSDKSDYYSAAQSLTCIFPILSGLQLHATAEHYFTDLTGGGDRNLVLFDAALRWKATEKLELTCRGANLLNKKQFNYSTLGSLSVSETRYALRSRSVLVSAYISF
ncbi:MAG: carboxypeptidase-like regulatory domain-containing protein [Rikenellaceae bacterium]|nr:carboxypeptidase-like regulatory domain-containing protein [Rikenellaceae bacterium]